MRYLWCAVFLASASTPSFAQEAAVTRDADSGTLARLFRRPKAEHWASAPAHWDLFPAPPSPLTFEQRGGLDLLFSAPDAIVGGTLHGLSLLFHDEGDFDLRAESRRSITARVTGAVDVGPFDRPFSSFLSLLYERESKYFSRWSESTLSTLGVEEGDEAIDGDGFLSEQRRVFVHALGRRYLGRYGESFSDNLRREAFDVSRWESIDYLVGPTVVAGYLYLRGWDGRIRTGDLDCRIHVKPIDRISAHLRRTDEILVSAAAVEFIVADFPIRAIVSCGVVDGSPEIDFIGLGTSTGMVRKAIKLQIDPAEHEQR